MNIREARRSLTDYRGPANSRTVNPPCFTGRTPRISVAGGDVTSGLDEGIELFNAGHYWEAHEAWERDWMPDRKGPDSGFYKGLIQVAAGCLHYTRRNRRGAVNKWTSGADYLRPYLPSHRGVQLKPLVDAVDGYLSAIGDQTWPELAMPIIKTEA